MHAGVGDHQSLADRAVPQKPGIVVVRRRACPHTIVTARAAVQVDHHRRRAVEESVLGEKLQHVRADLGAGIDRRWRRCLLVLSRAEQPREVFFRNRGQHDRFHDRRGDHDDVGVADDPQRVLQRHNRIGSAPIVNNFLEAVNLAGTEIIERAITVAEFLAHARKAGLDQDHGDRLELSPQIRHRAFLDRLGDLAHLGRSLVLGKHAFHEVEAREDREHRGQRGRDEDQPLTSVHVENLVAAFGGDCLRHWTSLGLLARPISGRTPGSRRLRRAADNRR